MLEFLINPKKAEKKPWEMFFVGLLYSILSILLANFLFVGHATLEQYTSIFIVFFMVMFSLPFMYYLIKYEEKKDLGNIEEKKLIKDHGKALLAFLFLFLGFIVAFAIAYVVLPSNLAAIDFKAQTEIFCFVNSNDVSECVKSYTGAVISGNSFNMNNNFNYVSSILSNNFFVMVNILIFSFLFGAGAIFILAWNASVIGAAIGMFAKGTLTLIPKGMIRYLIHGIPEIAAYFVIALAGGIISIAIIRHHYKEKRFWKIILDALDLVIVALIILIVSALIEVFITPLVMSVL